MVVSADQDQPVQQPLGGTESDRLMRLLNDVCDPEIPVLTLQDLGVLRNVSVRDGEVEVTITPTYSGCPAMAAMRQDIKDTLAVAGYTQVSVRQSLSPAWTTDLMSAAGRDKLRTYGIAPPVLRRTLHATDSDTGQIQGIECPQCDSNQVNLISEFGSTACKALYRCKDCLEPFDYFKCI